MKKTEKNKCVLCENILKAHEKIYVKGSANEKYNYHCIGCVIKLTKNESKKRNITSKKTS
jgi:hypothetical protein